MINQLLLAKLQKKTDTRGINEKKVVPLHLKFQNYM